MAGVEDSRSPWQKACFLFPLAPQALLSPFCLERSSQHFIICLSGAQLAIDLHPSKPLILLVPITCTTYLQKRAQPGFSQRCAQDYGSQCEQLLKVPRVNFLMSNLNDQNETYSLSFKVSLERKIRDFQYKVLSNTVFTNEKLYLRLIRRLIRLNVPFAKTYD